MIFYSTKKYVFIAQSEWTDGVREGHIYLSICFTFQTYWMDFGEVWCGMGEYLHGSYEWISFGYQMLWLSD